MIAGMPLGQKRLLNGVKRRVAIKGKSEVLRSSVIHNSLKESQDGINLCS